MLILNQISKKRKYTRKKQFFLKNTRKFDLNPDKFIHGTQTTKLPIAGFNIFSINASFQK